MRNRIVTAVKQRFSIRKLSIGAASVLLGTSLYFMGGSATIVHADTGNAPQNVQAKLVKPAGDGQPQTPTDGQQQTPTNDNYKKLDSIGRDKNNNDTTVNDAIDKYAQGKQEEVGNNALIRASGKEPTTPANTADDRGDQVDSIAVKLDGDVKNPNQEAQKINDYKNAHPNTVSGEEAQHFADQGLSIDDEPDSEINQITVDHNNKDKGNTLSKGQSETIDGIHITHTDKMTHKEQYVMKINSDNKVIVDFQHNQCSGKEITVTYDDLKNSYYLENINNKTNKIKISKIERTFSHIQEADKIRFTSDGHTPKGADGAYDECYGPQLIIYNDPSDGFFYNNITQVWVKDIYYDDQGSKINFDTKNDNNKAWIFVTSLNSNGGGNVEKVSAQGPNNSSVDVEKIAGSTVTNHNGLWYSDNNNNFGGNPDWDNRDEANRFGFVGTVAVQYHPGMTLQYSVEDWQWGSHWACTQTQVVSSLDTPVIIYDHIKDGTENVTGNDDVNMTVHYVMDDDSKAPSNSKQTVNFTETGVKDKVTGKIAWTPADSQTLNDVTSPVLTGYTADIKTAKGKAINFGDPDINVTVHYSANAQTAKITYIDDTTKNNLDSQAAIGKFGQAITFETAPADEIDRYEKQGYVLVSSTFDNNKYQADNSNNVFYVHLKHDTKNVSRSDDVNITVHYIMDDNSEAPSDNKQTVNFTENGIQDLVTKHIDWTPAVSQTFKDVNSPVLTGYTADIKTANGKVVNFGDNDINVTVHYSANTQTAMITYIDDTEKKTLSSDNQNGKFNQVIAFEHDPAEVIKGFEEKGYVFVSNTFDNQTYQADNSNNVFEVHFVHGTKNVSRKDDVNMTVHYVMDDNSEAPSDNKQTLNFTENGIQDLVTKHIDWTTANSQTFKDVVTPKVAGYTPDQDKVTGPTVNFGDNDVEVTVTYSPNVQLGDINYIDDDTKKTLTRDNFSGRTNEHEDYTSTDRIQEFENKGYELVSNDYPDGGFNFDNNDRQDQVFEVHFKHGIVTVTTKNPQMPDTPINPDPQSPKYPKDINNTNKDVKRTIDYKFKDGKTVQPTVNDSLHFERTVVIDKVTGAVSSDTWTQSQNFNDIQTPAVQGYTPDKAVVSDKNIGHDHQDIVEHVVYSPDTQHMTITYIDDTTGETLHTDNPNGVSDQDTKYTTTDTIKQYEKKHYKLVSDSTNGKDLIFDHDDNANQTYEVHFVHGTHAINQTTSPKQTIHYVYTDGLARQGKVADDNVQQLSFKRDGYNDEVTGTDHWNAWTPANSNYNIVDSPIIQGYTPDKLSIDGSTVNPTDKDIEITVTYNANKQTAKITYIDDTTNTKLDSKDASGKFGQTITFETVPADEIENYKKKGYILASNNFDNQTYQAVDSNNSFEVHLKHGIVTVTTKNPQTPDTPINPDPQSPKYSKDINNTNHDVKRMIDYKFKDGNTAQPTVNDSLHFERTVVIDKVTGTVSSDTWTQSQDFNDVQTPAVQGYTPDKTVVSDKNIGHDHQDIVEHVVYSPDTQHMTITYIDDTTGETLHTDNPNGVSDQDTKYTTTDTIKQYEKKHYKLVSDSTNGKDLIFDHDDNANQTYEVHFVHSTHTIDQTTSPKQTIHYVYADDLARQGKVADDNVQQLSFKRDGYNDEVTGTDHWNAWTPANGNYNAIDSPVVQGYTPDKSVIEKSTVNPTDKDTEITVVYNADKQAVRVIYVDKTTNDVLTSDNLSGKSDKDSGYNTKDTIGKYQSQHYVLTEDETNGKNVIFDHDDQQDQTYYVYFVHGMQKVNRQDTVTSTIDYKFKDSKTAQSTVTQTKQFSENGVKDLVTGKIVWDKAEPQKFDDVTTPAISGYTPNKNKVAGSIVNFGDKDIAETVTYTPDKQNAKVVFIDDTTKMALDTHNLTGVTNGHESYSPSEEIDKFVNKHYVLVPSGDPEKDYPEKGFTYDNNDSKDQVFEIHFVHGTHDISDKKSITETITYTMSDGSTAPNKVEKQVEFNRVGKHDDVTNTDTWDEWQPNKQSFSVVPTPEVKGYTSDTKSVEAKTVTAGDKDISETITYTPNKQNAKVVFIDDTTKMALDTHNLTGVTNGHESYSPSEEIDKFVNKHYVLVPSGDPEKDYPEKGFTYDNNDNKDQVFEVHFKHSTHDISNKKSITETIIYTMSDGSKAPNKVEKQIEFNRVGKHDDVTNTDTWDEWQPNKQSFSAVPTPEVKGYTSDTKSVEAKTVTAGDKDISETITYTPNKQNAKVVFIDDTTKMALDTHNLTGVTNGHESYSPSEEIEKFIHDNYVFVSSDYPEKGFTYDNKDSKDQVFEVHFKHSTHDISNKKSITETITYTMSDGSTAPNKVERQIEFSRVGKHDDVTNTDTWDAWQPNKQSFSAVPTPDVKGYTSDTKSVEAKTVTAGDKDINETITYTPNKQKATVLFIDDTTKTTLDTHNLTGVTNGHESYSPSEEIEKFIHDNYVFVSSDYPEKGFTYDNKDSKDQVFEVHFKHSTHDISNKKSITETIIYTMSDGSTAPNKVERQIEFSRVGKHDDVTNTDTWDAWQPNKQSFSAVPTPDVKGYTPNVKSVEAKTVTAGDKDINITITYTPNKQKAKVVFIDDTTKKILDTHDLIGVTNSHEKYNPSEEIDKFIHDNYVFVSSDYPEKGFTYDNDDSKDQVFEVHLRERPTNSDTPTIPGNTEDSSGSNGTPTDSDNPEKDNGGSDTVDKPSHKTPVKRNANKKHQDAKKTKTSKISKTAKVNPNKVNTKVNRFTQPKLKKVQESTNTVNSKLKHNALPQTGEKHSNLMAMLGLAISSLGMIGTMKSKKRKDN